MKKNTEQAIQYIAERYEQLECSAEDKFKIIRDEVLFKFDFILSGKKRMQNMISEYKRTNSGLKQDLLDVGAKEEDFDIELTDKEIVARISGVFKDEPPETVKHKGVLYFVFKVKKQDEISGIEYMEPLHLPADLVDKIVFDYVNHGNNMSQQEVVDKYGLSGKAWNVLKSRLNLTKLSDGVTNSTLDELSVEERSKKIEDVTRKHIDSRYKEEFRKTHERELQRTIKTLARKVGQREFFLEQLSDYIEEWKPVPVNYKVNKPTSNDVQQIIITDIHRGKKGTMYVDERLNDIFNAIIRDPAPYVDMVILGDLVETIVQDGMHKGQIEYGMDYNYGFGFDLMLNTVNKIQELLLRLHKAGKKVVFHGISGNHDRLGTKQQDDVQFTGGLVMYEMLKRGLSNTDIEINYHREVVNAVKMHNIHYIMAHGCGNFDKRNPHEILAEYGDPTMYNIMISGDKHHLNMKEYRNSVWIKVPSTAGKGTYDTDNGFYSEPGYLKITPNEHNTADIMVKRLQR